MNTLLRLLIVAALLPLGVTAAAHEADLTTSDPGYRPPCEHADAFLDSVGTATIAVLPTIVRREDRTAHFFDSQARINEFLNDEGIARTTMKPRRVKMLPLQRVSQWDLFQYGMDTVSSTLEGYDTGADYTLVMEMLLPVDHVVWGIEVYILDRERRNAFSFLLNEHHEIFADAKLVAKNSSEKARARMIEDATMVGLAALRQQISQARNGRSDEPSAELR